MIKVSFSDELAIAGSVLAIVLVVLDKAGKLKGPMLISLLAVAAAMTLPLAFGSSWVGNAPSGMVKFTRGMLMVFVVGLIYSAIAVWISTGNVEKTAGGMPKPESQEMKGGAAKPADSSLQEVGESKKAPHAVTPRQAVQEFQHPLQDRHFSLEQANYLVASVSSFSGQTVALSFVLGDTESQVYAQEIAQILDNAHWNVKRVVGLSITFRGVRLTPQDPTDVPQAAEALLRAFNDQNIPIARDYVQPMSFEYNGIKYVPTLYLFVGKNGKPTPIPPKYAPPLIIPPAADLPSDLREINNSELGEYAGQMAIALRDYEIQNRRRFEAEWHIQGTPLEEDSYRGVFEKVLRPRARALRDEMQRRLAIGPTMVWAIDADALDGPQPLRDAGNYLDELARRLKNANG